MLPGNTRKMDKSTILQKSIDFLHKHKGEEIPGPNTGSSGSLVSEPVSPFIQQKSRLSRSRLRSGRTGSLLFLVMKSSLS